VRLGIGQPVNPDSSLKIPQIDRLSPNNAYTNQTGTNNFDLSPRAFLDGVVATAP
jgi:hypothetical protein